MIDNSSIIAAFLNDAQEIENYIKQHPLYLYRKEIMQKCVQWKDNILDFIKSSSQSPINKVLIQRFEFLFNSLEKNDYSQNWLHVISDELKQLNKLSSDLELDNKQDLATLDSSSTNQVNYDKKKVFIVHGHNETARERVARTLSELKLKPIILHEQIDGGKTIIEKFEDNSNDVGFAVILLTADDLGKAKSSNDYHYRARQNVIFEMGFFMAKLGRSRVFLLKESEVEEPNDISGVIYTKLDNSHDWAHRLVKELKKCKYNVSADDIP